MNQTLVLHVRGSASHWACTKSTVRTSGIELPAELFNSMVWVQLIQTTAPHTLATMVNVFKIMYSIYNQIESTMVHCASFFQEISFKCFFLSKKQKNGEKWEQTASRETMQKPSRVQDEDSRSIGLAHSGTSYIYIYRGCCESARSIRSGPKSSLGNGSDSITS